MSERWVFEDFYRRKKLPPRERSYMATSQKVCELICPHNQAFKEDMSQSQIAIDKSFDKFH